MTTPFGKPIRWLSRLAHRLQEAQELTNLTAEERRTLLNDLHLSEGELTMSSELPRWRSQLPAMLDKFGVAAQMKQSRYGLVLRDLQRVCSGCPAQRRCARALNAGASAGECRKFCPNAFTLDALASERTRILA